MNIALAVVLLGLAYLFASLAIDTGRWTLYLATIIALILAIKFLVRSFKRYGK